MDKPELEAWQVKIAARIAAMEMVVTGLAVAAGGPARSGLIAGLEDALADAKATGDPEILAPLEDTLNEWLERLRDQEARNA